MVYVPGGYHNLKTEPFLELYKDCTKYNVIMPTFVFVQPP